MSTKPQIKSALTVALGFFILSFLWILLSDRLLLKLFPDASELTQFQTFKGWFYVLVATFFIYYLVSREFKKHHSLLNLVNKRNEWNNLLISNIPNIDIFIFNTNLEFILLESGNPDSHKSVETKIKKINLSKTGPIDSETAHYLLSKLPVVFHNKEVKFELKYAGEQYLVKGIPIKDDNADINAALAIFINQTEENKLISELTEEKNNYEQLFNEYHSVNKELSESYHKLSETNAELKQSEERYRAFINQTIEAVFRIDVKHPILKSLGPEKQVQTLIEDGIIAECNPVFSQIYDFGESKSLVNTKISEFNNIETVKEYHKLFKAMVQHDYKLQNFETIEPDNSGNTRYFSNNLIGIEDNKHIVRIWGTKAEITERKTAERELLEQKQSAEYSDNLKTAFLANMSHEVRTPLNGIMGFARLLCKTNQSEANEKYTDIIKKNTNQLLSIINDILDISRIETHQIKIVKETFFLNELIDEIEQEIKAELGDKSNSISVVTTKSMMDGFDKIKTDKSRLYQVFSKLYSNAIKFTKEGEIEIGYDLHPNNIILFYISDTGIGIEPKQHDLIFNLFRQIEDYTSRQFGGTGLGLSISKGLVSILGGDMKVISEVNKGARFEFTIPVER